MKRISSAYVISSIKSDNKYCLKIGENKKNKTVVRKNVPRLIFTFINLLVKKLGILKKI